MTTVLWIVFGVICFVAMLMLLYVYIVHKIRKTISKAFVRALRIAWRHVGSIEDAQRRVLEAEKVADKLLSEMGYNGTFAEKLKAVGPRLNNAEALWEAHKLRNRIAHEPGIEVKDKEVNRAIKEFEKAIMSFVRL